VFGLDNRPHVGRTFASQTGGKNKLRAALQASPARGRRLVCVSQRLRRQGPDDRDPRVRRWLPSGRSDQILLRLGVPMPSVLAVSVGGAHNAPTGNPNSPDGEVVLDIEVAGAVAPRRDRRLLRAQHRRGFINALYAAIHATAPTGDRVDQQGSAETVDPNRSRTRRRMHRCRGAGHHRLRRGRRPWIERHRPGGKRDGRFSGVVRTSSPAAERASGQRRGDRRGDRMEHARRLGDRRRRQRDLCAPGVSEARRRAEVGEQGRQGWPRRTRCRWQRRQRNRLPDSGRRRSASGRRHKRGRPAVGGPDRASQPGEERAWDSCTASFTRCPRARIARYHRRRQRCLQGQGGWDACTGLEALPTARRCARRCSRAGAGVNRLYARKPGDLGPAARLPP
jgi:hypothetical protein